VKIALILTGVGLSLAIFIIPLFILTLYLLKVRPHSDGQRTGL